MLSVTTPVVANERDSTASVAAENLQRKVELKYTVNYKNSANEIVESFEKIVEKQTNSTDLLEATIAVSADELTSNTILKDYELIDTASGTQNVTLKENEIKEVNFSVQRKKRNVVFKYKILVKDETGNVLHTEEKNHEATTDKDVVTLTHPVDSPVITGIETLKNYAYLPNEDKAKNIQLVEGEVSEIVFYVEKQGADADTANTLTTKVEFYNGDTLVST